MEAVEGVRVRGFALTPPSKPMWPRFRHAVPDSSAAPITLMNWESRREEIALAADKSSPWSQSAE
jgi:hypothetical protein